MTRTQSATVAFALLLAAGLVVAAAPGTAASVADTQDSHEVCVPVLTWDGKHLRFEERCEETPQEEVCILTPYWNGTQFRWQERCPIGT